MHSVKLYLTYKKQHIFLFGWLQSSQTGSIHSVILFLTKWVFSGWYQNDGALICFFPIFNEHIYEAGNRTRKLNVSGIHLNMWSPTWLLLYNCDIAIVLFIVFYNTSFPKFKVYLHFRLFDAFDVLFYLMYCSMYVFFVRCIVRCIRCICLMYCSMYVFFNVCSMYVLFDVCMIQCIVLLFFTIPLFQNLKFIYLLGYSMRYSMQTVPESCIRRMQGHLASIFKQVVKLLSRANGKWSQSI